MGATAAASPRFCPSAHLCSRSAISSVGPGFLSAVAKGSATNANINIAKESFVLIKVTYIHRAHALYVAAKAIEGRAAVNCGLQGSDGLAASNSTEGKCSMKA